jgi:hypothetical protein
MIWLFVVCVDKYYSYSQSRGASAFSYWESLSKPTEASIDTSVVRMLEDNEPSVTKEAGDILLKLIGNVLRDPNNIKFRDGIHQYFYNFSIFFLSFF